MPGIGVRCWKHRGVKIPQPPPPTPQIVEEKVVVQMMLPECIVSEGNRWAQGTQQTGFCLQSMLPRLVGRQ